MNKNAIHKMVSSVAALVLISMCVEASNVWMDNMNNAANWSTYQATITADGHGTTLLQQTGTQSMGKAWAYAGRIDVSPWKYLHVKSLERNGGFRVAVSGANDANYQEFMVFSNQWEDCADISTWSGNGNGEEDVYIQLIVGDGGASATCDYVAISDVKPIVPAPGVLPPREEPIDPYLATPATGALYEIPVLMIGYYPTTNSTTLDSAECGDSSTLAAMKEWVTKHTILAKYMLEEGSRYHGYRYTRGQQVAPSRPALGYRVVRYISVYEKLPRNYAHDPLRPDYYQIVTRFGLEDWVNKHGIKEVWLWAYHHGDIAPDESNMSSPLTGDISNSCLWSDDLPVYDHTYILFNYNFTRSANEFVEDHLHQYEAALRYIDYDLFERRFCPFSRAGCCHKPPNTTADYDWCNTTSQASDIEDWQPDRAMPISTGDLGVIEVNANTWSSIPYPWPGSAYGNCNTCWFIYWMQAMPGRETIIPYQTNRVTCNWWHFAGDWDASIRRNLGLSKPRPDSLAAEIAVSRTVDLVGETNVYTVDLINYSSSIASNVVLTDALPTGLVFVAATSSVGTCSFSAGTVACTLGHMAAGAFETVSIRTYSTVSGSISNRVLVTFDLGAGPSNYWVDVVFKAGTSTTLASIVVMPANPSIWTGASQQFTATGTYSDGSTQDITSQATWTSSETGMATINEGGLATGISDGITMISASLTGVTGSTVLSVQSPPSPIHYVSLSGAHVSPFTNWYTAATNIQAAMDVASDGDTVVVSNGIYATGGRVVYGALTNRVAITKPVTLRSVNGPAMTIIQGAGPGGESAVRCAYVGTNAVLEGFTLTNGATRSSGDYTLEQNGGGVWCESSGVLSNCVLTGNSADRLGGGACNGTLYNCTLTGNSASSDGGGVYGSELYNCIAYYNTAPQNPNYSGGTLNYCCTLPMPSSGVGNFTNAPGLAGLTNPHLTQGSPCIDAGNNAYVFTAADLDGEARTNGTTVDVGCDEFWADSCTGTLRVAMLTPAGTNAVTGYPLSLQADIGGRPLTYVWRFGDGASTTNETVVSHAYESPGEYSVVLEAANLSGGVSATVTVRIVSMAEATRYVATNGNDAADGMSWATAKAKILAGVAAATTPGALVLVSNGVYATGGAFAAGMTNRVAITNAVTVQSVNGPEVTIIQGQGPMGKSAVRCAYVTDGAKLVGFTLTNGFTQAYGSGGGIYCDSAQGIVSNCTLTSNSANYGGGAYKGTLYNCTLTGNRASESGGGVYGGTLYNCTLTGNSARGRSLGGGGAYNGMLYNCTLTGNSAHGGGGTCNGTLYNCTLTGNSASDGGGAYKDTLYNCTLTGNSASSVGGGAFGSSTLYNCTLTGNSATYDGGGTFGSTLNNCIAYYNTAPQNQNYSGGTLMNYCCTLPMPSSGAGNFTNAPGLAGLTNPHLTQGSPCIDAGNNAYVFTAADLDGEARTNGTTVDVGCDEFWAGSCTGTLHVAILTPAGTNALTGDTLSFQADIGGCPLTYVWRFGDGASTTNETMVSHAYESSGKYSVVLEAPNLSGSVSATVTVRIVSMAGATRYVATNGNDAADGMSWATAKATIQAGIAAATTPGGLVVVSNGVYATGGAFAAGLTNRVVITNELTVQSVNGPEVTIIQGQGPMGIEAVRCAYVADGAKLVGFTLTNGFTQASPSGSSCSGGGIYCDSTAGIVSNCTLAGNSARIGGGASDGTLYNCTLTGNSAFDGGGGGVRGGTLYNCTLTGNSASSGGGAHGGTLYNCTLTDNSASDSGGGASYGMLYNCTLTDNSATYGGGAYYGTLYNCIVYYNDAARDANYYSSIFNYSCTTPSPGGSGNITSEPQLASCSHLAVGSLCRGAGHSDYAMGTDIDGEAWRAPPSMGCDEVVVGAITGTLSVSAWATPTNVAVGFPIRFRADIVGRTTRSVWDFGDGTILSNKPYALRAYASPGVYAVLLRAYNESYPQGITATVTVYVAAQTIHYVKLGNVTPIAPYTSWETAATNIQDALDAASQLGALVLVSNGIYATGGRVVYGAMTNRVAITKPVTVRSVNGPAMTIIQGARAVGDSAVRCAYVGTNAVLEGFTLTNGATRSSGDVDRERCGGGVWCESSGAVSNCILTGNSALSGGGAYDGTLYNCTFSGNLASSGGGAYDGTLYNCTLTGNSASTYGGGAHYGTLYNCTLTGNSANISGGGAYYGTLYNCTLTGNSATNHSGGAYNGTLYNCIVYYNTALSDSNYRDSTLNYSCTTPDPGGVGNITNDPRFVNAAVGDVHLQSNSPCLNAGTNQDWMVGATDMDGNPRLDAGGRVDMGAYEYQGMSIWPSTTVPERVDVGPDSAVELGVKFRSDVDGIIAGIRFYKAAANTGTHIGNLWTSNGTLLATVTFINETALGWQQALFATPVTIASNTVYVASYHADNGHYSEDVSCFQGKGVDNPPLHMLMNGVFGGNGVYRYGASSLFPNQTWNAANYYVDVVFQAKPAPTLKSIGVTPMNPTISTGGSQQFTATGTYSDGSTKNLTSQATWTSSIPGVAMINTSGLATGVSTGTTTISATLAGVVGATMLTVQSAPLVITTTSLPPGIMNMAYTATLTVSGGITPYTWSMISGTLPLGLTLNPSSGVISGTPTVSGTFSLTVQVSDAGSHTATKTLSITITSMPTVVTIWPSNAVPGRVDDGPDSAVELGVKFKSDVAGIITGIRFYKAVANTGAHTGNLWTITGTLLAKATFSNETASGWQQALFTTPVVIVSNTVYVASYHADNGHYSCDLNYFTGKGMDNSPLHALANGVVGGNGVYAYGTSSVFPNQTWNAANYWVDVVFQPVQSAPLVITTTSLSNGVMNMAYTATLRADGGTMPYSWSIINGTLPPGLTLNPSSGVISGTPTATGTFSFTVQVSDAGSHTATKALSITILSMPTVITIWPSTAMPGVVDDGPDSAVELGVKFKSDVAGTITGIRFYKAEANTGSHTGNLWSITGTRLATVTFSNETASGWQQALFATPVAIASNTIYVVSYHANNGHYSADVNYFQGKGMDNPPLHALANGVSGGNGVYRYGAGSLFPNQTWNAANYWVDVMFQPASPPPPLPSMTLMAVGENVERWPWVWTSGDFSKECGASNLIDGNTNTMWIGDVGGEPWRIILDLGVVTDVTGMQLMFKDVVWKNKEIIGSRDSEVWFDYLAETNEWVSLRYFYVDFWGNEHGAQPPAIREIIWRER